MSHATVVMPKVEKPVVVTLKGGEGSGHRGHSGRPGKRGGSLPGIGGIFIGVSADAAKPGTPATEFNAMGINQQSGAPIRGTAISPNDPRIPDTVYHMTTNLPAVEKSGKLLARGAGGLGGDSADQIVSLTVSGDIANQLASDTKFTAGVAREFSPTEPRLEWNEKSEKWISIDSSGSVVDRVPWAKDLVSRFQDRAKTEGWEFSPAADVQLETYGVSDWVGQYFTAREFRVNIRNPLFQGTIGELVGIDPSKVGVISIPKGNLNTGALITDFDLSNPYGLREVRVYGDVPVVGSTFVQKSVIVTLK